MKKKQIILWLSTFLLPLVSLVLYIICLDTHESWQGILCIVLLVVFVVLYVPMNKKITHKDGYTYFQALLFYIKCKKNNIESKNLSDNQKELVIEIANSLEWARELEENKIVFAYYLGRKMFKEFKKR